ncbi:MAG: HPr-rel-A system PqqD family peptide chaperone [Phycisphaerae bacterium]
MPADAPGAKVWFKVSVMMSKDKPPTMQGQRPLSRTDVRMHELDGEALVFDPASTDTHRLNQTALFIWRQCDGRQDAQRIADRLVAVYDVSPTAAIEHVERMLKEFQERGLIVETGELDV